MTYTRADDLMILFRIRFIQTKNAGETETENRTSEPLFARLLYLSLIDGHILQCVILIAATAGGDRQTTSATGNRQPAAAANISPTTEQQQQLSGGWILWCVCAGVSDVCCGAVAAVAGFAAMDIWGWYIEL